MSLPAVTIEANAGIVVIRFAGDIDLQTFVAGREALQKEPGWSSRYVHVFDFSAVTDIDLSKDAIEALATAPPVFDKSAPQILVVRDGSFEFAIARAFAALARGRRSVHIVGSLDEARAVVRALRPSSTS
ncbi:MAG TPA: hypothetical protein VGH28_02580 [Polyangiaceae bacterium]|jgi:hypothetical protein